MRESKERSRSSSTSCVVWRYNLCIIYLICRFSRHDERYNIDGVKVGGESGVDLANGIFREGYKTAIK